MANNNTVETKLADAVIGATDRDTPSISAYGYLTKTSDSGPERYRLYPSLQDRSTFLEFEASAVTGVGPKASDGAVEIQLNPEANVRHVISERVTPARFLSGALTSQLSNAVDPALFGAAPHIAGAVLKATAPTDCGPARTHCSTCVNGCTVTVTALGCGGPHLPTLGTCAYSWVVACASTSC